MSKIRIKNFGPIKEGYLEDDGWMDIKKVTVFIGDQGSGKSSVAKLISTFTWMEKSLNRGDGQFSTGNDMENLIAWQRLKDYIRDYIGGNYEIEYIGDRYEISYTTKKSWPVVKKIDSGSYIVPKVMYVPAERNFLSTIKDAFDVTELPGPLTKFAERLKGAQIDLNGLKLDLPFENFAYEYDERKDISYVVGIDYKINLLDSSSGLQSFIPLYLVTRNLSMKVEFENDPSTAVVSANQSVRRDREISKIMLDKMLTSEEKAKQADAIFSKYHNKCFINIVEEPEQNLFPTSQRKSLNSLLKFNKNAGSKLIMTTHSPYTINYLTLAVKACQIKEKIASANLPESPDLLNELYEVVPEASLVGDNDWSIYELKDGRITRLKDYMGVPEDENYLNHFLADVNSEYGKLRKIEKKCL
jgi:predicted ATPase